MLLTVPDGVFEWLRTSGVRIGLVIVLAVVISRVGTVAVRGLRRRVEGDPGATAELTLQRTTTLVQTVAAAIRAGVWTLALLLILGQVGLNLAPLIAGAGVVGVALGFGAQSLVRDFLSGFFILLENQFAVGDQVEINAVGGTVAGRVEAMTLRATSIRSPEGIIHIVPNGNVQQVANRSRGVGLLEVEVRVPPGEDVGTVTRRLEELLVQMADDPGVRGLVEPPRVERVDTVARQGSSVLVTARVRPSRRDDVERELRRRIALRFVPVPQDVTVADAS